MDEHISNDLRMAPVAGNAPLYVKIACLGEETGISGTHVDNSLNFGAPKFEKILKKNAQTVLV